MTDFPSPLSIVIPCKDDWAVIDCVASIPDGFPIAIVFNGCADGFPEAVLSRIPRDGVLHRVLDEANLSLALETGVWMAPGDRVLLMDADCVFAPGAVEEAAAAMDGGTPLDEVFKGRVLFRDDGGLRSRLVARSRQHHTAEVLTAYKPPLALDRRIAARIGGYLFDRRLVWREDADLDHRIRQAGIAIRPVEGCLIHHEPLEIASDLRSTFRYGMGEALADALGKTLTDVPRSVLSTLRSQGILPALYMLFRNRVYTAGYLWTKLRLLTSADMIIDEDPRRVARRS